MNFPPETNITTYECIDGTKLTIEEHDEGMTITADDELFYHLDVPTAITLCTHIQSRMNERDEEMLAAFKNQGFTPEQSEALKAWIRLNDPLAPPPQFLYNNHNTEPGL